MTRLFLFPFAGGSSQALRRFAAGFTLPVKVEFLDYPGHGRRFGESLLHSTQAMADDALARMREAIAANREPYALFGHSLGAQVAFLVARRIQREGLPSPERLFVSARRAPSLLEDKRLWSSYSDAELTGTIRDLGGTPPEVLESPELLELFLPILRADISALENGNPESPGGLAIPITVLRGRDDDVSAEGALAWSRETSAGCDQFVFPGGHFFVLDHSAMVAERISDCLRVSPSSFSRRKP